MRLLTKMIAVAALGLVLIAHTQPAFAQKQKGGAQNKQAACLAKARAESDVRFGDAARRAAYQRCMGR